MHITSHLVAERLQRQIRFHSWQQKNRNPRLQSSRPGLTQTTPMKIGEKKQNVCRSHSNPSTVTFPIHFYHRVLVLGPPAFKCSLFPIFSCRVQKKRKAPYCQSLSEIIHVIGYVPQLCYGTSQYFSVLGTVRWRISSRIWKDNAKNKKRTVLATIIGRIYFVVVVDGESVWKFMAFDLDPARSLEHSEP